MRTTLTLDEDVYAALQQEARARVQMILVDANVLLYAYNSGATQHPAAARWLEVALSSAELVRFAWARVLAFLRIS